jgi:CheY-like chemotaxis protein
MVTEFADGERGMRELVTQPQAFALVILDLMLGESMAGMDFRLQQLLDSQLASVPTIVITASDVSLPGPDPLRPKDGSKSRSGSTRFSNSSSGT